MIYGKCLELENKVLWARGILCCHSRDEIEKYIQEHYDESKEDGVVFERWQITDACDICLSG